MHEHSNVTDERTIETRWTHTKEARQRGQRGVECNSHAWSSGLGECLLLKLLGAFCNASDNPFTTSVPFIRVCSRRVFERGLVIEEVVLAEPHTATGEGASCYGQFEFDLGGLFFFWERKKITHWHPLHEPLTS